MIWGCGADLTKSRVHSLGYSLKLETNETTVNVPAVRKIEVLGEKISPLIKHETASANSVLGERKIPTGDRGDILVFLLVAMCAFAGIVVVRIKNA